MSNKQKTILAIALVLLGIQLYRPAKTNPVEDPARTLKQAANVPPEVHRILERSCNDCHSYNTTWPWYSHVAPSSWLLISDVNEGRKHLNFSEWTQYPPKRQQRKLSEVCEEVEEGAMPLRQYTWVHQSSKLSSKERQALCEWTKSEQQRITAATGVEVPPPPKGGMHAAENK